MGVNASVSFTRAGFRGCATTVDEPAMSPHPPPPTPRPVVDHDPGSSALLVYGRGGNISEPWKARCLTDRTERITVGNVVLKAQVRGGRLVLDEPTDLPDGTEVELTPVLDDDLDAEERRALESSLARSAAQLARNDLVDAAEVLRRLERGER